MEVRDTQPRKNDRKTDSKSTYKAPKVVEIGTVEQLTHGSRENTADSGSGYQGG